MISPETRMMGLPYGEEIMSVGRTMWTQCTSVTDRRTDRGTDRITMTKTVQRIASHGKNPVKGRGLGHMTCYKISHSDIGLSPKRVSATDMKFSIRMHMDNFSKTDK